MDDKAQAQKTEPSTRVFLTVEVSGEARRVAKYVELLQMELQTTVAFMNAMFRNAEPSPNCPAVFIHPTQVE